MDKLLHFGISAFISSVMTFIFSPAVGVSFTAGVGIGKEAGDYMNYGSDVGAFEFAKMAGADLASDGLGLAVGTFLGMQLRSMI